MGKVTVIDHPLVQHKLSHLRDINTGSKEFRELVQEITMLLAYEATRDLPLEDRMVETPFCSTNTKIISGKKIAFVPIFRAGLVMVEGMLSLVPAAKVGHIGIYRDPDTFKPINYYCKLPFDIDERTAIIVDSMVATGGSAVESINVLKRAGCKKVKIVCIIAAPEGIKYIDQKHPDVDIFCASIDEGLNDNGYVVPGIGDAGDRLFGTK